VHSLRIGKLDQELKSFVTMELANLNSLITSVIKIVQGGLLGLVGLLIAMLYLSILQPVFDLITII
jgi:type II secretory pathway component PulF